MDEFDRFRNFVLSTVRVVGRTLTGPDDDWTPVLLHHGNGQADAVALGPYLDTTEGMEYFAKGGLKDLIRKLKPERAALVAMAYVASIEPDDELPVGPVRDIAGSREVVTVQIADGSRFEEWEAEVSRDGVVPPKLGPFERRSGPALGVLVNALKAAFQEVEA